MEVFDILLNDYMCLSNAIKRINNSDLDVIDEQIRAQFRVKNVNEKVLNRLIKRMIVWFESNSYYIQAELFAYETLCDMFKTIDGFNAPDTTTNIKNKTKKILISHSSKDKKYCDALVGVLRRIGIDEKSIVYTSDATYGVPLGKNIFEFLKEQFETDIYVLFVFSDNYFESAATLNEMGAAWVLSSSYTSLAVPGFDYSNSKFQNCAVDPKEIAGDLSNNLMITDLKNKLVDFFGLEVEERLWLSIISDYLKKVQ